MPGLNLKLRDLGEKGESIKVAIAGVGQMGRSLISHIRDMEGMQVLAVANRDIGKIASILKELEISDDEIVLAGAASRLGPENDSINKIITEGGILQKSVREKLNRLAGKGKLIVADDLNVLFAIDDVNVVIDATGNPEAGAFIASTAILHKKHIITLNVEADVTIGPYLKKMADDAGVVYTVSAGDEPAALKELYDFADILGFEVIAAGKGKNNPLDRYANPASLKEYARSKGSSPNMMTSFVDGTKSMIEMACISNSTGLVPDCRGMHGPKADIKDLINVFRLKEDGGILSGKGVVDFAIGNLAPGVFLIYSTKNKMIKADLEYLMLGSGPYYLLYRPYHLTSIETPLSVARAYFYGESTITPDCGMVSEVITLAKRDLKAGEVIDGIGKYMVYGLIEKYGKAKKKNLLPIGISEGCVLKKDIEKDKPIEYNDVSFVKNSLLQEFRRSQDKLFIYLK
ncbi:MAG: NAD(P)-dependent oxidoreductase [Actinomycetota bacterium]|nr:NAD(P)-dependent oxidoreductase [Actinomycetota bacterium]